MASMAGLTFCPAFGGSGFGGFFSTLFLNRTYLVCCSGSLTSDPVSTHLLISYLHASVGEEERETGCCVCVCGSLSRCARGCSRPLLLLLLLLTIAAAAAVVARKLSWQRQTFQEPLARGLSGAIPDSWRAMTSLETL